MEEAANEKLAFGTSESPQLITATKSLYRFSKVGRECWSQQGGRELLMEEEKRRGMKGREQSKREGLGGTDKTQARLLPGAEALENKFGNIIPQDLH